MTNMAGKMLTEEQVAALRALIQGARNVIVTCHVSPDGDALGASLACASFLRRKGKNVATIVPNIFPNFLKWLPGCNNVLVYEGHEAQAAALIRQADLIVCLDFNDPKRLLGMQKPVTDNPAPRIMIDHHLNPSDFCSWALSRPDMSSTCELLYNIIAKTDDAAAITRDEAACLYTGMMTDTGCFAYNSNRSALYRIIANLIDKGIDKDKIYRNVFHSYTAQRLRLLGYILYVKTEYFPEYCTSLMTLTKKEQKKFVNKKGDTEGFVNIPLQINKARLSVFLREDSERPGIKVSLRSTDDFPCNLMAEEFFHGGGHRNAAGGELFCTIDEAAQTVRKALKKYAPLLQTEKQ